MRKAAPRFSMRAFVVPVLLFAAAVAVYLPAVTSQFVWDDNYSIHLNPLLRDWGGLWRIWTTIGTIPNEEHYWPLTYTVLWLEMHAWGEWAPGFHLVNFILHGLIVAQIWHLMRRLQLPGAWLGALLFALHPVHVEAVVWVISIKDLLAALFYLLAVECYLNHEDRGGWKWLAAGAAAACAAMLSKATPVTLPAALAILTYYRRGRFRRQDLSALAVFAAATFTVALADMWVVRQISFNPELVAPPLAMRLVQAGRAFWFYLEKLTWPVGLTIVYPPWPLDPRRAVDWVPLASTAIVAVALALGARRIGRGPLACWLAYGVTLGPVLGILYFAFLTISPAADRYQYLASMAPLAGAGALAGWWIERQGASVRRWLIWPAAALLVALAAMTHAQSRYFYSQEKLFERARQLAPGSAYVYGNLGMEMWKTRQYAKGEELLNQALRLAPEAASSYFNVGTITWQKQRPAEAEKYFAEAVRLKPNYWEAVSSLGGVLIEQDRKREAAAVYRQAIEHGCKMPGLIANLAWLMATSSDPQIRNPREALRLAQQAVNDSPTREAILVNILAAAQSANGRSAEAAATAREALKLASASGAAELARTIEGLIPIYERGEAYTE